MADAVLDKEVGPTKVWVMELGHGMLLSRPAPLDTVRQYLAIYGNLPSQLHAVERNTAECYVVALNRGMTMPWDAVMNRKSKREVDVVCHDEHRSNHRAERCV